MQHLNIELDFFCKNIPPMKIDAPIKFIELFVFVKLKNRMQTSNLILVNQGVQEDSSNLASFIIFICNIPSLSVCLNVIQVSLAIRGGYVPSKIQIREYQKH